MPTSIADLFVSVSADVSAANAGLSSLNNQLNLTSNSFRNAAPAALVFEAAGAAVFGTLGSSVKVAADFEQSMANIRAVMNPAEAQQFGVALQDLALRLGRDTVFTSAQAAAGINELIKAGIPAIDVINGAADAAVNLAAASGIPIAEAAALAAQSMNAFGIQASDMTHTSDVLAGVVNATAASMSDLHFGLQVVGPTAHSLGLSLDDTAKAIGLLTNAGESGQVAGTGLRQMLLELTPTTKPATEEMKKLGLITADGKNIFFDATGKLKSMSEIAQILQNALKGMSAEQRTAALNTLFTRDAINAASILAEDGSKKFELLDKAMEGITAAGTAAERLNTFLGSLQNLQGSLETVQILVGATFVPVLRSIADAVKSAADGFASLNPTVRSGVVNFILAGAAVLTALGAFILFAPSIAAIVPALEAVAAVLVPMIPIAAALAGVFLLLKNAWDRNIGPVNALKEAFANIGDIIQAAFSGDISGAIGGFLEDLSTLNPGIRDVITGIQSAFGNFLSTIQPILTIIGTAIDQAFQGNFGGALDIIQGLAGSINPAFASIIGGARELAATVGPILGDAFQRFGGFVAEHLPDIQQLGGTVLPILGEAFRTAGQFVSDHLPDFQALASDVFPRLNEIAGTLGLFWQTTLAPAVETIAGFFRELVPNAQTLADEGFAKLDAISRTMQQFWADPLAPTIESIKQLAGDLAPVLETLKTAFQNIVVPPAVAFFNTVLATLTQMATQASSTNAVGTFFSSLGDALSTFGNNLAQLSPIFTAVANLFGAIFNLIGTILNIGVSAVKAIFDTLGIGFEVLGAGLAPFAAIINTVLLPFRTLIDLLSALAGNADLVNAIANVLQTLANGINAIATALQTMQAIGVPEFFRILFGSGGGGGTGGAVPVPTTPGTTPTVGGQEAGGPLIGIGQLIISSEAEAQAFLDRMGQAIAAAAKRASTPSDNSANPALAVGTV